MLHFDLAVAAIEFGNEMVGELVSALHEIGFRVLPCVLGGKMVHTLVCALVNFVIGTLICGL